MINLDLVQIAILGFATGLGTTIGAELAKEMMQRVKKHLAESHEGGD